MLLLASAAAAAVFFGGTGASPVIAPLDQASGTIIVSGVNPGARVDVYANTRWIGGALARADAVRVRPISPLEPGDALVAVERSGAFASYGVAPTVVQNDYVTYHYDDLRTGWDRSETSLTQSTVGSSSFGRLFSTAVDGDVEAQPLVVSGLAIPNKGTHDVVYAATENDSVYALDAASGAVLWKRHYANSANGYAPMGQPDVGCEFIAPVIGITGTPVIDRSAGLMFFDAQERRVQGMTTTFHHFLHAVDITTGRDVAGSPVEIQASLMVPGGGMVTFDPQWQLQRPGLLLSGGVVYLAFGSFCDLEQRLSHGWVLGYAESSLKQVAAFTASLSTGRGMSSFWAGGYGIAADASGAIYGATGNGDFNGNSGATEWGDTILKLSPSLGVLDYFTPFNESFLNGNDLDLGGGGPMLLPPQSGQFPDLLVEEGKASTLFLVDRDDMGQFTPNGPDRVVQELQNVVGPNRGLKGGPGYYVSPSGQPVVLYCGGQDKLKAFALLTSPTTGLSLIDQTQMTFHGEGGAIPSVTSNGTTAGTAVAWAAERPSSSDETVHLVAFRADHLSTRLVDLPAGPWLNPSGGFFVAATIIDGRAYVGSANAVTGFGLR
jgi:outer membrane protein assembly factor BamB